MEEKTSKIVTLFKNQHIILGQYLKTEIDKIIRE